MTDCRNTEHAHLEPHSGGRFCTPEPTYTDEMIRDFPALELRPVTERHVNICAERGHAEHTTIDVDGRRTTDPHCPRCGKLRDWVDAVAVGAEPWIAVAEAARVAHHAVASHTDWKVAGGESYNRSRRAFKEALHAAYPTLNTDTLYGVWVDCMEDVRYCANIVRTYPRDDLQRFTSIGRG